jgi:hypothetical protein
VTRRARSAPPATDRTEGDPPLGVVGRYVTIEAGDVTLFPYDV